MCGRYILYLCMCHRACTLECVRVCGVCFPSTREGQPIYSCTSWNSSIYTTLFLIPLLRCWHECIKIFWKINANAQRKICVSGIYVWTVRNVKLTESIFSHIACVCVCGVRDSVTDSTRDGGRESGRNENGSHLYRVHPKQIAKGKSHKMNANWRWSSTSFCIIT